MSTGRHGMGTHVQDQKGGLRGVGPVGEEETKQDGAEGSGWEWELLKDVRWSSTQCDLCFVKTAPMQCGEAIWRGKKSEDRLDLHQVGKSDNREMCKFEVQGRNDTSSWAEGQGRGERIWDDNQICSFYRVEGTAICSDGQG